MLVSVMEYLSTQMVSLGGVHDRVAEVRDLGVNSGCNGALGTSVIKSLYITKEVRTVCSSTVISVLLSLDQTSLIMKGMNKLVCC